ncbi:hypothetical protein Q8A67_000017 [Cirrhinus molitorella]|uniref:Uncharacterized protein n=1 Tax=Cirrhinus molitorella TaxID=172907 RepID=A0AA88Q4M6_9TELE|nr:hypothetical protein Q8A67_000017 [Cirrhinus molitorella]
MPQRLGPSLSLYKCHIKPRTNQPFLKQRFINKFKESSSEQMKKDGVTEMSRPCLPEASSEQRNTDVTITEMSGKTLSARIKFRTGNYPGQSGVEDLNYLLQDPNCELKTLRFLSPAADEVCQYVSRIVGKNLLLLRELNLSEHELGDTRVNQIASLLHDKHCQLNTLTLCECSITEKQCLILTLALKSNPLHLRELDLSENKIQNTGVNHLCDILNDSHCNLERLRLSDCCITGEGCSYLTSALKSNPSHLRELDLSENNLGDSGVKNLSDLLMNPQSKLEEMHLCRCSITEKQCLILTSGLKSNPSHLRELDLSKNQIKNTGVNHLCDILNDSHCKLERLKLSDCDMTDEGCCALTSALKLNPSHLRELDLSENNLGDSGVKNLSDLLMNPQCKLQKLHLNDCGITDVSSLTQSLTNTKALQFLEELDLRNNKIGDSKQQLIDVLRDSDCNLKLDVHGRTYKSWFKSLKST